MAYVPKPESGTKVIWNNLPKDIKTKPSVNSFKFALKKYYLESYKGIDRFELLL